MSTPGTLLSDPSAQPRCFPLIRGPLSPDQVAQVLPRRKALADLAALLTPTGPTGTAAPRSCS